jgi:hypothetical protein
VLETGISIILLGTGAFILLFRFSAILPQLDDFVLNENTFNRGGRECFTGFGTTLDKTGTTGLDEIIAW